jgi:signal transduction histidine kinase
VKSRSLILGFTAVVLLAVAGIQVLELRWQYQRARIDAERRASDQAFALAEYVRGAFVAADSSLRQIAAHSRRIGGPSAPSEEWLPILHAARAALAEDGSLSVVDANGVIRHTTFAPILGHPRADNYLFQHLSRTDDDELVLDVPFISPVSKDRWIIPVGRRLESADGRFQGMVVQVITPDAFRPFFGSMRIGRQGVIKLFHPGGRVVVQQPPFISPPDPDAPADPLFPRIGTVTNGVLTAPTESGGPQFISAFRRVDGPDLVVAVSLSEYEVLAEWRMRQRRAVLRVLVLAAIMGVLVTVVLRQVRARATMERALATVQRTEAARLRDANERLGAALENETRARHESEEASRLKDEFLMTLSHELRTPLNAVLGWLHMLRANGMDAQGRAHALATIERNAQAQVRLIEDLLEVSRAITGKLQVTPMPTNAGQVATGAAATLQPAIAARGIDFRTEIEDGLPAVQADPERLQQVVWNLLSNAIKFSPPGGLVEMSVRRVDGGVEIMVRDRGVGIAPAFLPFVFDRFRQADAGPRREHGGLGLGLAIARHLVELHGGTITAESEGLAHGSTFRVVLPASAVAP